MDHFELPEVVKKLVLARNELRYHYLTSGLKFTLDGNLVGDLGEAIAVEIFGITLSTAASEGWDGIATDGRTVQVKATGTRRGPVFRNTEMRADHLLFFDLDFDLLKGRVIFNGPEAIALETMPSTWVGQRAVTRKQIEAANERVPNRDRLHRID